MLTLAGIFSTVAFAAVMVVAAVASGNPPAAGGSLAGAAVTVGVVACAVVALRSPQGRVRLERAAVWLVRLLRKMVRRPMGDPGAVVRVPWLASAASISVWPPRVRFHVGGAELDRRCGVPGPGD